MSLYYTEPYDTPYKDKIIAECDCGYVNRQMYEGVF